MLIKKTTISLVLGFALAASAFAGSEDWNGTFTFQDSTGVARAVAHTPTGIQFLFFSVVKCLHLGKGAKISGVLIPEDVTLCTNSNVETFISQVQKLGLITNKTVTLGASYKP